MRVPRFRKNRSLIEKVMAMPMISRIGKSRRMRNRSIIPIVLGLGIGALIGFGAALMVAPRSGRMTRMMLAEKGNDLAYQAKKISGQAKTRIQSTISRPTKGVFERNGSKTPAEMKREVNILESDIDKTYDL